MRYAIYYLPSHDSALARCGAQWLGWDVHAGQDVARIAQSKAKWVSSPRLYGFHATLKAPFRLADGQTEANLCEAVSELATKTELVSLGQLKLAEIGSFLALTAPASGPKLNWLAASCVQQLDRFRAPASQDELDKRRAAGLDEAEDAYLMRWGYPYVLDRFRFHMTVTGPLDKPERDEALQAATAHFEPALQRPVSIDALSILRQPAKGVPFQEIARFALNRT